MRHHPANLALLVMFVMTAVWTPTPRASAAEINPALIQRVIAEVTRRVPLAELAGLVVASTRRSISVGPFVGAGVGLGGATKTDSPLSFVGSFGLSGTYFSNPLFSLDELKNIATEVLKEQLGQSLRAEITRRLRGGVSAEKAALQQLKAADYAAIATSVSDALLAAVRARVLTTHPRLPSPRFGGLIEATRLPVGDAWQLRTGVSYGISRAAIGPVLMVHIGDQFSAGVGAELTINALFGAGPRPWHVQGFARYTWMLLNHVDFGHQGAVGVRLILDVI